MKRFADENRAAPSAHRRRLLASVAALPAMLIMSALPRTAQAQGEVVKSGFALSSPARAMQIRQRVPADMADRLLASADAGLARELHVRPVVHTQGLLPHEGDRDVSQLSQEDWRQTLVQALAWCVSGNAAYATRAVAYIDAWVAAYSPSFDPIDETDLADLLLGFDLVQDRLSPSTVEKTRQLGRQLATGYLGAQRVGDRSTGLNNWQSHRIKLAVAGAYVSGDAALIAAARDGFVTHVDRNINSDGRTFDFAQRDAMHYVVYDLDPLLMAASMAAAHEQDWYGATEIHGKLAQALNWLRPYALGEREHEEFVHSTVAFDARRASVNVKGFGGPWQRGQASSLYWVAARLDPEFESVANALHAPPLIRALFA